MRAFSFGAPDGSGGPEALLPAMAACGAGPESAAWRELARVVDTAGRAEPSVARLWPPRAGGARPDGTDSWRRLARALAAVAARDTATRHALTAWLNDHPGPAPVHPGPEPVRPGPEPVHPGSAQIGRAHV